MFTRASGYFDAAEHPGDFINPRFVVQLRDRRPGIDSIGYLGHAKMVIRQARDLRQVRNTQHLAITGQLAKPLAHHFCDTAADACIDFIEDQARHGVDRERHDLNR